MSHRRAVALVLGILLAYVAAALPDGSLVFPHDNSRELSTRPLDAAGRLSNRLFSDLSSTIIPEIAVHLRDDQSGWLATWNPHVELGRPMFQVDGLGKAFVLTHLLFFVSNDPFVIHTLMVVLAIAGIACFGYGFCESQGLSPSACATTAIALSLGIWATYWISFVMFLWGVCWMLGLLWALARFLERASPTNALLVVFAAHALLLASYPQQAVWAFYIATGFTLVRLWRRADGATQKLRTTAQLIGLGAVAAASIAPVFADLLSDSLRSTRTGYTRGFYLHALLSFEDWRQAAGFATRAFDPFWFGNPITANYPRPVLWGHSVGVPIATLAAASLLPSIARRAWGWQILCVICFVLSIWPAAYLFGVDHLGLSLSRWTPIHSAQAPLVILAAYSVDRISRATARERRTAAGLACLALLLALPGAFSYRSELQPLSVAFGLGLFAATVAFLVTGRGLLLAAVLTASVFGYGQRMLLNRSADEIRRSSPLVEAIDAATPTGARFAKVRVSTIPPNQEGLLNLRSIHTYDSVAPRAYAHWVRALGGRGMINKGRRFPSLRLPDHLDSGALAQAGVATILSGERLPAKLATLLQRLDGLWIYRNAQPPMLEAQFRSWDRGDDSRVALPAGGRGDLPVARLVDRADHLIFDTTPSDQESLLFVSQQHHPRWFAFSDDEVLTAVVVDDLFLGVVLPPGTDGVELRFLPWVRWSWIPQLAFLLAGAGCTAAWAMRHSGLAARLGGRAGLATPDERP